MFIRRRCLAFFSSAVQFSYKKELGNSIQKTRKFILISGMTFKFFLIYYLIDFFSIFFFDNSWNNWILLFFSFYILNFEISLDCFEVFSNLQTLKIARAQFCKKMENTQRERRFQNPKFCTSFYIFRNFCKIS